MKPLNLFAVVQPGLEKLAEADCLEAGIKTFTTEKGGISFVGHHSNIYRLNNVANVISRILINFPYFYADTIPEFDKKFRALPLQEYLGKQNICFRVNSYQSKLYHETSLKERIVFLLEDISGRKVVESGVDEDQTQLIIVTLHSNKVKVSVDTTGSHLHKRGYAAWRNSAPLRETIAAAMLISSNWREKYCLYDPFCGSGTILTEAIRIKRKYPLHMFRKFSFQYWPSFQEKIYDKIKEELNGKIDENVEMKIMGTDISARCIEISQRNLDKSFKNINLTLFQQDFLRSNEMKLPDNSIIVTNPPYGIRINNDDFSQIYRKIAQSYYGVNKAVILPYENLKYFDKVIYKDDFVISQAEINLHCIQIREN